MQQTINIKGKLLDLSSPKIMVILNITPDSFCAGSRYSPNNQQVMDKTGEMLQHGATFIDVGGHSTRPGAASVSEPEELDRILPVISEMAKHFPEAVIIIDTFRSNVARQAVEVGAMI